MQFTLLTKLVLLAVAASSVAMPIGEIKLEARKPQHKPSPLRVGASSS
ncbi:hypothetical protein CC1G_14934 [Coprinopsis cinerea okayama7|uniref:Uncharacterized protein n=1 Tax=Coprinopsis cinerea (strain Okayama-7 / 130 / ATCC MYA-4618 / FGSC 9003) TaxID=240176 RepID=D6RNZ7_COPC7|nr:hypothetical protein CC1G_14934 [Coprinopsis cinerea okayama7\|eukprot:XP_002910603.1 hypothetical protein CC1G_14934 [Coprinopsis cinerea okayama7\